MSGIRKKVLSKEYGIPPGYVEELVRKRAAEIPHLVPATPDNYPDTGKATPLYIEHSGPHLGLTENQKRAMRECAKDCMSSDVINGRFPNSETKQRYCAKKCVVPQSQDEPLQPKQIIYWAKMYYSPIEVAGFLANMLNAIGR
jgi:hypothetical protein